MALKFIALFLLVAAAAFAFVAGQSVDISDICVGSDDGEPHYNPNDCTTFIMCNMGFPIVLPCADGKIFVLAERACVLGDTATCTPH